MHCPRTYLRHSDSVIFHTMLMVIQNRLICMLKMESIVFLVGLVYVLELTPATLTSRDPRNIPITQVQDQMQDPDSLMLKITASLSKWGYAIGNFIDFSCITLQSR